MRADCLLSLRNVSRFYGEKLVFRNLDLDIEPGRVYLLLGPNGAGKTTLLRLLCGLLRPDSGEIERRESLALAYLGHATFLYPALTARQNLRFWADLHNLAPSEAELLDVLSRCRLAEQADDKVKTFSRGMCQRLNFARCLLLAPDLLLLDEPFTGMDSANQTLLRAELKSARDAGSAIMLVSHAPDLDGALADVTLRIEGFRVNPAAFKEQ